MANMPALLITFSIFGTIEVKEYIHNLLSIMKRRKFVHTAGLGLAAITVPIGEITRQGLTGTPVRNSGLTAGDLNKYLRTLAAVKEPSVDRIVIGDPGTVVKKIGTAWMPYWETLKEAVAAGVNVLVVHEPTFYTHWDLDGWKEEKLSIPDTAQVKYEELIQSKKQWIEEKGMVIIRCHDVWDKFPGTGIPFALGQALGFSEEDIIRNETYYNVYKTSPVPAAEMARRIAAALAPAGQPGVAFYGNEKYTVGSVGVGTGCICDPRQFMNLDPDLFIAIDDSIMTWTQTTFARDTGRPLVVINHGTSEEFGMRTLNKQLKSAFPGHEVIHFSEGCTYKWITG
jgi:putative NIF3 family GTP cyclohydrolase 1 type 2